jgi:hypothetical protein
MQFLTGGRIWSAALCPPLLFFLFARTNIGFRRPDDNQRPFGVRCIVRRFCFCFLQSVPSFGVRRIVRRFCFCCFTYFAFAFSLQLCVYPGKLHFGA